MAGLVIHGRYEVIRRLAIGGMGEIFLARHAGGEGPARLAILKTLRPELAEEPGALEQFIDEARLARFLRHPNIVAVYEVGVHEGVHFIAMEYIGGVDLSALLKACHRKEQRIPLRVAAAIVKDAAAALDFAHYARDEAGRSLRVVHRDVSPQNIMIRSDGLVKVVDFGVAVSSHQMHETRGDKIKGKIRYMSPEQLLGEELDGRSDVFSLGVVMWELCTGKPLFAGSSPIEIFQKILAGDAPALSTATPDALGSLDTVLRKMLAPRRDHRFARGADVAAALQVYLDELGPREAAVGDEVRALVAEVAGAAIALRVADLSQRAVSFQGASLAAAASFSVGAASEGSLASRMPLLSSEDTRVMVPPSAAPGAASDAVPASGKGVIDDGLGDPGEEQSDGGALLWAAEHSGVMHGERRFVTVLHGLLPGWGALAAQIANVPLGAFGVTRLKNLFFKHLDSMATAKGGCVVRRGPDAFVIAFGLDVPRPDDAVKAVACAIAVQQLLDDLARDPRQQMRAHVGIAAGVALATNGNEGPVRLAGAVSEKAERFASLARTMGKPVLVSAQVGELVRGRVGLAEAGMQGGEAIFQATGLIDGPVLPRVRRKKILIADDAEVVRRIEEEILRPFDYAFAHAKNGAEAVRIAVEELPDLILLDIQMPVMDGAQVLALLKKTEQTKHIPIVVITTIGRAHDQDIIRRGGADAFLTKPVKPGLLIQTVRGLLQE